MTETTEVQNLSAAASSGPQSPSVGEMLGAFIERGITEGNVAAFEKLVALHERMEDKRAERDFAAAFAALQNDMPQVAATKAVPGNNGTVRYHFAPFEDIMEQVKPILRRHGLAVAFSMTFGEGRVTQTCTLTHIGGHSRQNSFTARIGKGPPGATETQADGAASTYAKRFALCDALNIVIDKDTDGRPDDARAEGQPITPEQAQYLREQVAETGSNEAAFLRFAGARSFEGIMSARYAGLVQELDRKRRA